MTKFICDACGAEYEGLINVHSAYGKKYVKCTRGDGFAFEVVEEKQAEAPKKTTTSKRTTKKEEA